MPIPAKHSPTPEDIAVSARIKLVRTCILTDDDDDHEQTVIFRLSDDEINKRGVPCISREQTGRAREIVARYNAHAALVAALEDIANHSGTLGSYYTAERMAAIASAALASARGTA